MRDTATKWTAPGVLTVVLFVIYAVLLVGVVLFKLPFQYQLTDSGTGSQSHPACRLVRQSPRSRCRRSHRERARTTEKRSSWNFEQIAQMDLERRSAIPTHTSRSLEELDPPRSKTVRSGLPPCVARRHTYRLRAELRVAETVRENSWQRRPLIPPLVRQARVTSPVEPRAGVTDPRSSSSSPWC